MLGYKIKLVLSNRFLPWQTQAVKVAFLVTIHINAEIHGKYIMVMQILSFCCPWVEMAGRYENNYPENQRLLWAENGCIVKSNYSHQCSHINI